MYLSFFLQVSSILIKSSQVSLVGSAMEEGSQHPLQIQASLYPAPLRAVIQSPTEA